MISNITGQKSQRLEAGTTLRRESRAFHGQGEQGGRKVIPPRRKTLLLVCSIAPPTIDCPIVLASYLPIQIQLCDMVAMRRLTGNHGEDHAEDRRRCPSPRPVLPHQITCGTGQNREARTGWPTESDDRRRRRVRRLQLQLQLHQNVSFSRWTS